MGARCLFVGWRDRRHVSSSAVTLEPCASHKLKPLDRLRTNLPKMLFELLKLLVGDIDQRALNLLLLLLRQQRHDRREIDLRLTLPHPPDHFRAVFGEVFMQQRHSKLIELAARTPRPPWSAWVSRLERSSRGFSERHEKILARFGSIKNDSFGEQRDGGRRSRLSWIRLLLGEQIGRAHV